MHEIHNDPLRHYPHLIHLLAFQRAMRIVKQQLAAQNVKIWDVTSRDLKLWADGYLRTHRAELIAAIIRMVRTDPEFLKLGESEAKRRGRMWPLEEKSDRAKQQRWGLRSPGRIR
jgi:hypothetical protein